MNNQRIPNETLYGNYVDGQILQHTDVNKMIDVLKTGVNANYDDITKMKNGTDTVGKAASLNGLVATTFEDGVLDNDDEKLPTSKKVKQYVDNKVSEATPQKGVDYFTNAEVSQITNSIKSEINNSMGASIEAAVNVGKSELDDYIEDLETSATSNFNDNYDSKLSSINSASSSALDDISDAKDNALSDIDSELSDAINQFNTNASNKTSSFNTNATSKTNSYNDNASSKLSAYNTNDENKTNAFNQNYSDKLSSFNTNAGNKQDAFDENASTKTNAFNSVADRKISILEQLIATIPDDFSAFTLDIVETLPSTGVPMCIYLVPNGTSTNNQNIYDEYLWLEETSRFEEIGKLHTSTDIDLSQYATRSDIANMITTTSFATDNTAGIVRTGYGAALDGNHQLYAKERTYQEYQNIGGKQFIGKSTLENVLAGKGYDNDIASLKENRDKTNDLVTQNTIKSAEGSNIYLEDNVVTLKDLELQGDTLQDGIPTPDAPIDVQVVKGNQVIKVLGKNLIKFLNINSYGGITITVNKDGSITASGLPRNDYQVYKQVDITDLLEDGQTYTLSQSVATNKFYIQINEDNKTNNVNNHRYHLGGIKSTSFTVNKNLYRYNYAIQSGVASSWDNTSQSITQYFQLEKGNVATTFDKYKEMIYNISLGDIELCRINSIHNKIFRSENKWYLSECVSVFNIDGVNNTAILYTHYNDYERIGIDIPNLKTGLWSASQNKDIILSDKLINVGNMSNPSANTILSWNTTNRAFIYLEPGLFNSLNEANEWLQNNNIKVYYVLETPIITEITNKTLLAQLNSPKLFNGVNNIICNGDLPAIMKIDAYTNFVDALEGKQDKLVAGTNIVIDDNKISATGGSTFSGSYNDLSDKPTLFSGSYNDLSNKPTIPDELKDLADDSTHRLVTDTEKQAWNNKSSFSGNYNDLSNKPTLFSGSYNDLSNKPTIPTVPEIVDNLTTNDATKTLSAKQGKVLKDALDNKANADEVIQEQSPFYGASTYLTAAEVIDLIHANKMNIMIYGDITPLLDRSEGN